MPGSVRVACNIDRTAAIRTIFNASATSAISPNMPYAAAINTITKIIDRTLANLPAAMASAPISAPTVRSSSTVNGAGKYSVDEQVLGGELNFYSRLLSGEKDE